MSEPEFKTVIMRKLAGFEISTEDTTESFTVEIKQLKTSQAEIKNAITKMQSQMNAMLMKMDEAE